MARSFDIERFASSGAVRTLAFGAVVAIGFVLCRRAIVMSDEGYLLMQAKDMLDGKILYRDLDSFVAPGAWFALAALFRVVDPSVIASRLLALCFFVATGAISYRIVHRLTTGAWALGGLAAYATFGIWAFPSWTWLFYSPLAICFSLAMLERLLAWRETPRSSTLLAAGAMLGLAIACKQNYGILAGMGAVVALVAIVVEQRGSLRVRHIGLAALPFVAGVCLVGAPVVAHFASRGALPDVYRALVVHPFSEFAGRHTIRYLMPWEILDTGLMQGLRKLTYGAYSLTTSALMVNSPTWAVRSVISLHVIAYWIPPLLILAGVVTALGTRRAGRAADAALVAVVAVCGLLFLGVFPRADFNHLMHVYQPVIVLAPIVLYRALRIDAGWRPLLTPALLAIPAALFAAYGATAAYWLGSIVRVQSTALQSPHAGVMVDLWTAGMIDFEVNAIRERTQEHEAVMTLPGLAMLNFLADRTVPSRYYNLYAVHIAHDQGRGVVAGAEEKNVALVVAESHDFFSDDLRLKRFAPALAGYVRRYFVPDLYVAVDRHLFLRRRDTPLPALDWIDVLSDCDFSPRPVGPRSAREHLLYDSLYHRVPDGARGNGLDLETRCRVTIPESALLSFHVGYRQPRHAAEGSRIHWEIRAWPTDGSADDAERLFAGMEEVIPVDGWASPPPTEHRIDVPHLAGRAMTLAFRTRLEGVVEMGAFDVEGFAVTWNDPRIEFPEPASRRAGAQDARR